MFSDSGRFVFLEIDFSHFTTKMGHYHSHFFIAHNFKFREKLFLGMSFREYLKSNLTLFNAIAALILAVGIPVMVYRILYD